MPFRPKPNEKIEIDRKWYTFTEHPSAPNMVYGQMGRRAIVYQLMGEDGQLYALKVFKNAWRDRRNAISANHLRTLSNLPGLEVCNRQVFTKDSHGNLIKEFPDLEYAVLMGWVSGETWQEIMLSGHPLSFEQSKELALSFLGVLKCMEQNNLAHCDLSGPNVIVTLSPVQVALVDVEDLYGPGLVRPEMMGGGSSGYAHKTAPKGLWSVDADRFAGAILLAEMLGWSDERVRHIGYGEQYFDPDEVQQSSQRYQVLISVLQELWGQKTADNFSRVWFSEHLEDCPSFQYWEYLINPPEQPLDLDFVKSMIDKAEGLLMVDLLDEAVKVLEEVYSNAPQVVAEVYSRALITRGTAKERDLDQDGALLDYQTALQIVPEGGLKDELRLIVAETKQKVSTPDITLKNNLHANPKKIRIIKKRDALILAIVGSLAILISFFVGRSSVSLPPSSMSSISDRIYFASNRSGNFEIYLLEESKPLRLTYSTNGGSWDPVTSPEGFLYFTSNRSGKKEIYCLYNSKADQVTLTSDIAESWSPFFVDNILHFVSNRSGKSEIWRIFDGKAQQVTVTPDRAISIISR